MKVALFLLTLCGAAQLGFAQTPIRSIPLNANESLGGAVRLTNVNTVALLVTSAGEKSYVRALTLKPDGATAGEARLEMVQQPTNTPIRPVVEDKLEKDYRERVSKLHPLDVYTSGNDVYFVETLTKKGLKWSNKTDSFKEGQLVLQHLDEQGKIAKRIFDATPLQKERSLLVGSTDYNEIAHYGGGDTFYVVTEKYEPKTKTRSHTLESYNLTTGSFQQTNLQLPPTPDRKASYPAYNAWRYLGHLPNRNYFVRNLVSHSRDEKPYEKYTLDYEVIVLSDIGEKITGFVKMIDLPEGLFVGYSGFLPALVEQNYPPAGFAVTKTIEYSSCDWVDDIFLMTTGALGEFYLDYATGNVLIYGEYAKRKPIAFHAWDGVPLYGFFAFEFTTTGEVVRKAQIPYPPDMTKKNSDDFLGSNSRYCTFNVEPVSGNLEFVFRQAKVRDRDRVYHLVLQRDFTRPDFAAEQFDKIFLKQMINEAQQLRLIGLVFIEKYGGRKLETRLFKTYPPNAQEPPLYEQVRQLHQQKPEKDEQALYLMGIGNGKALVLEHTGKQGGTFNVYIL